MSRVALAITFLFGLATFLPSCAEKATTPDADVAARAVMSALAERNYVSVSRRFCYPAPERKTAESAWLVNALPIMEERFGVITEPRPASAAVNSQTVGIGPGKPDDWQGKPTSRYAFRVKFERLGDGWVLLDFTDVCGDPALKSIQYALPTGSAGSLAMASETRTALASTLATPSENVRR